MGGQLLRTTQEHPFYVFDQGWTPVSDLKQGDWLLTANGDWQQVEEVFFTGELEVVYNLRVADHHTYFVGDDDWGWALWAHNTYISDPQIDAIAQTWNKSWSANIGSISESVDKLSGWALRRAYTEYGSHAYGMRAETLFHDGLSRMKCALDSFESKYNVEWQPSSINGIKAVAFNSSGDPESNGAHTRLDAAITLLPVEKISRTDRPKELQAPFGTKLPGTILKGFDISLNDGTIGTPKPYVEMPYTRNFFSNRRPGFVFDFRLGNSGADIYWWHQVFSRDTWVVESESQILMPNL